MLSKRNKFKNQVIIFVSDVDTDIGGYGKSYGSQSAQTMAWKEKARPVNISTCINSRINRLVG